MASVTAKLKLTAGTAAILAIGWYAMYATGAGPIYGIARPSAEDVRKPGSDRPLQVGLAVVADPGGKTRATVTVSPGDMLKTVTTPWSTFIYVREGTTVTLGAKVTDAGDGSVLHCNLVTPKANVKTVHGPQACTVTAVITSAS